MPAWNKNENELEDSSSEDSISDSEPCHDITNLSSALSSVVIGERVPPTKGITPSKLDTSMLDDSSDDDDSTLQKYKPKFEKSRLKKTEYKHISLDFSSSDEDDISVQRTQRNRGENSKGPWRFNTSRKEYTLSETSDSAAPNFRIPCHLFDKLYTHQKEGVAWMAGLHKDGIGGLLG